MRFGQLPSVREMTPDITPLLQARQMKDQAYQNIAGTVMQLAADKKKKALDKQEKEQAIEALTPVIDFIKKKDSSLDIDPSDIVGALGAKEAMNQVQTLARTLISEQGEQDRLEAAQRQAVAAETKNISDRSTSNMEAAIFNRFGSDGAMANQADMQSYAKTLMQENPEEYKFARIGDATKNAFSRGVEGQEALGTIIEKKESVLKSGVDTTSRQIERRGMIFDAAKRAYGMLDKITEEEKAVFNELNSEFSSLFRSRDAQGNVDIKNKDLQNFTAQIEQRIKERFPGTKASTFSQAIQSLSGQIANATLQETRSDSVDGSSGYGQLTGPELTLLKNFYGALVTESGFMADFVNVENTLRLIMEDMPRKSISARDSMYESVLARSDLGITRGDIDKRFKRGLGGRDPSKYELFLFDANDFFGEGTDSDPSDSNILPISPNLLPTSRNPFPSSSVGSGTTSGGNKFESYVGDDGVKRVVLFPN